MSESKYRGKIIATGGPNWIHAHPTARTAMLKAARRVATERRHALVSDEPDQRWDGTRQILIWKTVLDAELATDEDIAEEWHIDWLD